MNNLDQTWTNKMNGMVKQGSAWHCCKYAFHLTKRTVLAREMKCSHWSNSNGTVLGPIKVQISGFKTLRVLAAGHSTSSSSKSSSIEIPSSWQTTWQWYNNVHAHLNSNKPHIFRMNLWILGFKLQGVHHLLQKSWRTSMPRKWNYTYQHDKQASLMHIPTAIIIKSN